MSARAVIDRYQESQGWTDATVLDLLVRFVDDQAGGAGALDDFLGYAADDENVSDDDGLTDVEADAMTLGERFGYGEEATEGDVLGHWS